MASRQRGFTLTELILVIVVMGLLAGIAVPRMTNRQSLDEVTVRDTVKGMLYTGRMLAMAQRRDVCFVRNAASLYLVYYGAGPCSPINPAVVESGTGAGYVVEIPPGVVLAGSNTIRFTARGQLSPNANQAITVGSTTAVTIVGETGFSY